MLLFLLVLLDCLRQVGLQEKAELQEKEAQEHLDSGKNAAVSTKALLESLSKPNQMPLFYAGGIEILTELMKDCKSAMCVAMSIVIWKAQSQEVCLGRQRVPLSLPDTNNGRI